jgi:sigma-B regulation protein RsbU (phosphoserine phosphatase)
VTAAPSIVGVGLLAATAWAAAGAAAVGLGMVLPEVPVVAGLAASTLVRLGFTWVRTDRAHRLAQTQREQLLTELRVARDIQLAMVPTTMPAFPGRDLVGISASLEPAREVGGDFYDYFPLSDGRVCFAVGDVSGKGVGAALYMARIQTMLRSRATLDPSPASIVNHANDELARDNDSAMFVTLVVAILDLKRRELVWTNAGHNPPYVLRADGTRLRLHARHGPAVGAVEDIEYREGTMTLEPGDQVLLFTDGVTEAMDTGATLYGEERLVASIAAVRSHDETVRTMLAAVRRFQGEAAQADDITVLALQLGPR